MAAPLSVHTHTHTQTDVRACVHTRFFDIETSNLTIKEDQTQNVGDSIVIKFAFVLTEIAGVLYKRSKLLSPHQSLGLGEVYYFNANLPHVYALYK